MILLLDIGGTTTRVSAATLGGALLPAELFPTERDMEANIARIAHAARGILGKRNLDRVVAGVPGQIRNGTLVTSPNLPWEGRSLQKALEAEFKVEVHVLNDAVLGALGEAHSGAGKGAHTLLYMTFGTGIGAARVIDGKPDFTVGTETGHQYLTTDSVLMEAEDLVSGRALKKRYGKGGEDIRDIGVWKEAGRNAAIVLYNTILHFIPDRVVVGGSLVKDGSLPVEDIEMRLAEIATRIPKLPRVVRGTLGDLCGLYGAQAYAAMLTKERNRVLKNERRRVPPKKGLA